MDQKTILVVDNNEERRLRTTNILTEAGFRVLAAKSAEQAEILADTEEKFDLIVSAVVMEGGNSGIHLAEHVENSGRTNSTLLISHFSRDLLRYIPGFQRQPHFLPNPFTPVELLRRVREILSATS